MNPTIYIALILTTVALSLSALITFSIKTYFELRKSETYWVPVNDAKPIIRVRTYYPTGKVPENYIAHQQYIRKLLQLEFAVEMDNTKRKFKATNEYYCDVALSEVKTKAN